MIVDHWYLNNLVNLPPHNKEIADTLKVEKLEELRGRKELLMQATKNMFKTVKPRASVIITGEQLNLEGDLQSLAEFINLEADPIRRTALIEMAMRMKGIDAGALPKTEQGLQTVQSTPAQPAEQPVV